MFILILSDTHGKHKQLEREFKFPSADIIIHAGDISSTGEIWQINDFLTWFSEFKKYHYDHRLYIAGNHDFLYERDPVIAKKLIPDNIIYLEDSGIEIEGIKFWGTPISPMFNNWAFNRPIEKRKLYWDLIPDDIDILITHCPPYGILDFSLYSNEHTGCSVLLETIVNRVKPKFSIYGHIHGNYGYIIDKENNIIFINASNLNERYAVSNKPILIEIDKEKKIYRIVDY